MTDKVVFFFECVVTYSSGEVNQQRFEIEAEANAPLKDVIKEFMIVYDKQTRNNDNAPKLSIYYDPNLEIDELVTAIVLGPDNQVIGEADLEAPPAQAGYGEGTRFLLSPSQMVVGAGTKVRALESSIPVAGNGGGVSRPPAPPSSFANKNGGGGRGGKKPHEIRMARIRNEIEDFLTLVEKNRENIEVVSPPEAEIDRVWNLSRPLIFRLKGVAGPVAGVNGGYTMRREHTFKLVFPRGYPENASFKIYCPPGGAPPLFHPNVSPQVDIDGEGHYICVFPSEKPSKKRRLWNAIMKLEAIIQWRTANLEELDAMNKPAAALYADRRSMTLQGPQLSAIYASHSEESHISVRVVEVDREEP